jgi:RNA polymerase sigma-70 factor (ECF subfamily)
LHEDATFSMPPFVWWLRGRLKIRQAMLAAGQPCEGARLIRTEANGSPAFAQYRPTGSGGSDEAFALVVLDVADGLITDITNYLDAQRLFPLFDLPRRLER